MLYEAKQGTKAYEYIKSILDAEFEEHKAYMKRVEEAVELINAHNDNVDAQDVDIFISGFSLVYAELLNPISPILERYLSSSAISWQGRMRIALAIQQCKKLKKNNYGKRI